MMTVLLVELLRLRRSLAVALVVAAPCSLSLLALAILLDRGRTMEWRNFADSTAAIWAYLMLPMATTALSVLLAHVEQAARGWDHLLALPGWRGRFFAAKFATLMLLLAAMSALLVLAIVATGITAELLSAGRLLSGTLPLGRLVGLMARMWIAAGLVGLLQIWVALRTQSFVPPLVLGIGGTLVGVVTASARQGIYVPWLLPVNMLSSPERAQAALATALLGTALLFPVMLIDLSRRERR